MVKSGLAGHPEVASGDISLTDVHCTAPGHSALSLGPELAGAQAGVQSVACGSNACWPERAHRQQQLPWCCHIAPGCE